MAGITAWLLPRIDVAGTARDAASRLAGHWSEAAAEARGYPGKGTAAGRSWVLHRIGEIVDGVGLQVAAVRGDRAILRQVEHTLDASGTREGSRLAQQLGHLLTEEARIATGVSAPAQRLLSYNFGTPRSSWRLFNVSELETQSRALGNITGGADAARAVRELVTDRRNIAILEAAAPIDAARAAARIGIVATVIGGAALIALAATRRDTP